MKSSLIESSGYQVIDDFLSPEECESFLDLIASYRADHDLPEIHRVVKGRSLHYVVIDGQQIEIHLRRIWMLYHGVVNDLVNKLTNTRFVPLTNTRVGVNVNVMPAGDSEYRWHYDRNRLTAILYLNAVDGGEMELYPNYRILLRNNVRVQRILDRFLQMRIICRVFGKKIAIRPRAGRLIVMRGNRCWHSVSSVQGEKERINIILAYDVPDAQFPMEEGLDSYLYTQEKQTSRDPNYSS